MSFVQFHQVDPRSRRSSSILRKYLLKILNHRYECGSFVMILPALSSQLRMCTVLIMPTPEKMLSYTEVVSTTSNCSKTTSSYSSGTQSLRSSDVPLLHVPFRQTAIGKRSFSCAAPTTWNSLPASVINCDTLSVFRSRLKTHIFNFAYS